MVGISSSSFRQSRQSCSSKQVARLALVALVIGGHSSTLFAQARPFDSAVVAGKARAMDAQATLAAALSRNAQPDRMQDIVSAFVDEHAHRGQQRSVGYVGIHPLPRRELVAEVEMAKRQGVLPAIVPADAAATTAAASASATSASASSAATDSASVSASKAAASSSSPATSAASSVPTIMPATTKSSNSASSSSTSSSPTSSNTAAAANNDTGLTAFFSPHNKMFPLAVALTVVMGLGVLLILVAIGKCYSHRQMARELRDGKRQPKTKDSSVLTAGNGFTNIGAMERTRTLGKSLRRALTRGKLGGSSFARRNREGTVLIDVGDEVFAVSAEVAREYERERKSALSGSGSGASRLTSPNNQPTPLRQALYNAQLIVAASQAEQTRGKPQAPRGFDINQWRSSSAKDDDEHTLYGSEDKHGAYSFDTEKQMHGDLRQAHAPLSATVPVLTRGSGAWAIQRQGGDDVEARRHSQGVLQSNNSDATLRESALSHDRIALSDDSPGRVVVNNTARNGAPRPTKSILIKRSQDQLRMQQQRQQAVVGAHGPTVQQQQRRRDHRGSSTAPGSPKTLQQRISGVNLRDAAATGAGRPAAASGRKSRGAEAGRKAPLVLNPEAPARSAAAAAAADKRRGNGSGSDSSSGESRDLFRPLPMLPGLNPLSPGGVTK